MHYIFKTKGGRVIIRTLLRRLVNLGYATDRYEIQSRTGLTEEEFQHALDTLVAEEVVAENPAGQLSLTPRGVMCYEVSRTLTIV